MAQSAQGKQVQKVTAGGGPCCAQEQFSFSRRGGLLHSRIEPISKKDSPIGLQSRIEHPKAKFHGFFSGNRGESPGGLVSTVFEPSSVHGRLQGAFDFRQVGALGERCNEKGEKLRLLLEVSG